MLLTQWNRTRILKLLWAFDMKVDKLWIHWIRAYYIEEQFVMTMAIPANVLYLLIKKVLKCRELVDMTPLWQQQLNSSRFTTSKVHGLLRPPEVRMGWKELVLNNAATPRAKFILWLALWKRLAAKDRLLKFGVIVDLVCVFCLDEDETLNHLLFYCAHVKTI